MKGTFARAFLKAPEAPQRVVECKPHPFDVLHGTETGGHISPADLSWRSFSAVFVNSYLGISPSTLRPALRSLPIQHQEFSFIDIGCGKGRALFVAAEFPFRQLVGVELSCELCEIARLNVTRDPAWTRRIAIVNQDAAKFVYPEGPLVLFFYYPFYAAVLRRVLANLQRQLCGAQRPTYLLYADIDANDGNIERPRPRYQKVLSSSAFLRKISDSIYSLSPEDTAAEPSGCIANRFTLYVAGVTR
ncbi:MAG: class I SAM-dependent methyltransferase [Terracidiphilus sp.]